MERWYNMNAILYEMLYCSLFDRETVFMRPKHRREKGEPTSYRCIKVFKAAGLSYALNTMVNYKEIPSSLNIYYSLGKYKDGIMDCGNVLKFRHAKTEEWKAEHHKTMIEYDCLIDVDSPAHDPRSMGFAKDTTREVINLLDQFSIPYFLRFSGMGYHIVIPYYVFKHLNLNFDPDDVEHNIYGFYNNLTQRLHDIYSELIDENLHDSRRVTKVPYSLVFYNGITMMCWPFKTKGEFLTRNYTDFRVNSNLSFIGEEKIFRRGQYLFNQNEWTPACTDSFLRELQVTPCN